MIETAEKGVGVKLPNAHLARVEQGKIMDYLLNSQHRFGASKAQFFTGHGFHLQEWESLADSLLAHGQKHDVGKVTETGFGPRYQVDGDLPAPDGRRPLVRTIWQMDKGQLAPRLITAYPLQPS
jgi:hypothetical protein